MRVLALDVGERRIGVAISDPSGLIATPLKVMESIGPRRDVERIVELAAEHDAQRIVVGMPVSMDGVPRAQARLVQRFCDRLAEESPVPVATWDERLTTVEADRRMREAERPSRKRALPRKRKERRDAVAAAVLLQSYLESLRLNPKS